MTRFCFCMLALLALSGTARAEDPIYKCAGNGGAIVYSDKPCAAAKDMQRVTIAPPPLADIIDTAALCGSESGARGDIKGLDRATLAALPHAQRNSVNDALAEYARNGSRAGARWGQTKDGSVHLCLPTFADEMVEYIAATDGKLMQVRGGVVSYRNDPDTAAALLERCAETWKLCNQAPDATADSCVTRVPTCDRNEPWKGGRNCCPIECKMSYSRQRGAGEPGESAFARALYDNPSCIPGLQR
jgi:hypothetical protein